MENVESVYPLTPMQELMLPRGTEAPAGDEYVEQLTFALHGELDAGALERAWRWVIARHPAPRTAFFWEGLDRPLQVVRARVETAVELHDPRGAPADEREPCFRALGGGGGRPGAEARAVLARGGGGRAAPRLRPLAGPADAAGGPVRAVDRLPVRLEL